MGQNIYASFQDYKMAEKAVGALLDHGLHKEDISLIGPADGKDHAAQAETGVTTTTGADAAAGAAKGAGMGLAVGALGLLASLLIPGFGLVFGGGALATALGAAAGTTAAGAVAGGLTGFLKDQGVDEVAAHDYAQAVERGGALVELHVPDDRGQIDIEQILNKYGAENIRGANGMMGSAPMAAPMTTATGMGSATPMVGNLNTQVNDMTVQGRQAIPVVEEELIVGKREVERGGARIEKVMTERPVQEQVSLHEEHIVVDRRPVNRAATAADLDNFQEGTIELRETAEEAVISKQARVVEEVIVGKESSDRIETINDTVRRTDVRIEEFDGEFRNDFNTRYGSRAGASYDTYQPAYKYGYDLAQDSRYQNSDWGTVENSARTDWSSRNQGPWDDVKDAVRTGYDRVRNKMTSPSRP